MIDSRSVVQFEIQEHHDIKVICMEWKYQLFIPEQNQNSCCRTTIVNILSKLNGNINIFHNKNKNSVKNGRELKPKIELKNQSILIKHDTTKHFHFIHLPDSDSNSEITQHYCVGMVEQANEMEWSWVVLFGCGVDS